MALGVEVERDGVERLQNDTRKLLVGVVSTYVHYLDCGNEHAIYQNLYRCICFIVCQ